MTTWRDDPAVTETLAEDWGETADSIMEIAVAAYGRWLTSEIEKLPHGLRMGDVSRADVLALIEQEEGE